MFLIALIIFLIKCQEEKLLQVLTFVRETNRT